MSIDMAYIVCKRKHIYKYKYWSTCQRLGVPFFHSNMPTAVPQLRVYVQGKCTSTNYANPQNHKLHLHTV